jgi:hypothetical protein
MTALETIGFSLLVLAFVAGIVACVVLPPFKKR